MVSGYGGLVLAEKVLSVHGFLCKERSAVERNASINCATHTDTTGHYYSTSLDSEVTALTSCSDFSWDLSCAC